MAGENIASLSKVSAPVPRQVFVVGRVEGSKFHDGVHYTQVLTPAVDEYSRPQLLEVRGKRKLGQKGEEVSFMALLGGYRRKSYPVKDKTTGEVTMVDPVEMTLDLVE
ncbi:MAG: single-stranded DNA-binding protein [Telluria sp.]|nr:single-stranded DNA-binding protein [Telluria sp.]